MYGFSLNSENRNLLKEPFYTETGQNVAIIGELTKCNQLRLVIRNISGTISTMFACGVDIYESNTGEYLITSNIGILGYSPCDFVRNYLRMYYGIHDPNYYKPPFGIGWVFMDDTPDYYDEDTQEYSKIQPEYVYYPKFFENCVPTTFDDLARRFNMKSEETYYFRVKDTNPHSALAEQLKSGCLEGVDRAIARLHNINRNYRISYLFERVTKPLIWDEAVERGDVKEWYGLQHLSFSNSVDAIAWVCVNNEYFEYHATEL